ncbi:putative rRNA methylase [Nostocoides japonicum T1-X7]|uniref:Putative rRNA methylase n=1 Tax=Nostocoides japonicum T1-X7 TaxID=1194083 RepID=A0A077M025_9MICO|nr:RNA methyltransferase [Tetrasphaera japonica]CCH77580.1 putative rRNA methylase [Tetrasphaera japonica T1-X7]
MAELEITSPTNPRLKGLVALRRRRAREQSGTTLVEGYEELRLALDAGVEPRAVYHCPELMLDAAVRHDVLDAARDRGSDVVRLGRAAFERTAYREGPDGFVAEVPAPGLALGDLVLGAEPLVLVAEHVEKPGNLGAMLRTADAAGVDAVVAVDPVTDWGNPNVVRSSKGTVFSVPVASTDLTGLLGWLGDHGIRLVATTPAAESLHTAVDLTGPLAVAVGAEKDGLTHAALAAAADRVRIPMAGIVNSLNVATSAAIVVYEAVRQRR